jgi:hypothetical protein
VDLDTVIVEAVGRPIPTESVSGDAWQVDWSPDGCRIAVIDGLGHGPEAFAVATLAVQTLRSIPNADPIDALRACHDALRSSRGAAITVVTIDPSRMMVNHAGVGNVDVHVRIGDTFKRLMPHRGIVGVRWPRVSAVQTELSAGWRLIMHTDGIGSRFAPSEAIPNESQGLRLFLDRALTTWARGTDDATILAAAPRTR